jgi:hypothetical protein
MKNTMFLVFIGSLIMTITSCQKQPVADFTSVNYSYHAGETIHLINTSTDGKDYTWKGPDGKSYDSKDLDYPTLTSDTNKTLNFTLDALNGNKKSSVTKSIVLKQPIFTTDYFSVNSSVFKPTDKTSALSSNNIWRISALKSNNVNLTMYFGGTTAPIQGTYTLKSNTFSLAANEASLSLYDGFSSHGSYMGGQLTVTTVSPGLVRATFTNIGDGNGNTLSGDITFH